MTIKYYVSYTRGSPGRESMTGSRVYFTMKCIDPLSDGFIPCQFLRSKSKQVCVIRIQSTGAIIEIELLDPLDVTRACLVCATKPVDAAVQLGEWVDGIHRKCHLRIAWPCTPQNGVHGVIPPPMRYVRKSRVGLVKPPDLKRRKTSSEN